MPQCTHFKAEASLRCHRQQQISCSPASYTYMYMATPGSSVKDRSSLRSLSAGKYVYDVSGVGLGLRLVLGEAILWWHSLNLQFVSHHLSPQLPHLSFVLNLA